MYTPLSQQEIDTLNYHLETIRISFVLMIKSLAQIHKLKLYRGEQGNQTWSDFCKNSLNFSARYGHLFIQAFSVLESIELYNNDAIDPLPLPNKEAQTRALSTIPKDLVIPVWQATTAKYGNNPTGKQITEMSKDVTVSEALIMRGVANADVLEALSTLADKSESGRGVVTELLVTGYLQVGEEADAIPLADVRVMDLRRYEQDVKREAIARRITEQGGVVVTIYPDNPTKTAGILLASMTSEQAYDLLYHMEYDRRGYPYQKDGKPPQIRGIE